MFIGTFLHGFIPFMCAIGISYNLVNVNTLPFAVFFVMLAFSSSSVKDIEDVESDKKENLITLPITFGVLKSKIIILVLFLITGLVFFYLLLLSSLYKKFSLFFLIYFIFLFSVYFILFKVKGKEVITQSKTLTLLMVMISFLELILAINSKINF
jgi:4-hydroxybenzoate polyprenyltransferase